MSADTFVARFLCSPPVNLLPARLRRARSHPSGGAARAGADRARLMVDENWRFRPYYRDMRVWIAAGRIGAPRHTLATPLNAGMLPGPDAADGTRDERRYDLAACCQGACNAVIARLVDGAGFETSPADNLKTMGLVEAIYALETAR
ncbi:hypothetical protein [Roseomonas harenae]|uniref:hypothetical protein n=1 Tax=Muricoccus harenae TaxID=2692566 RepID=UPI0013315980|nr:hypothetical protein [Roseomonas harenae]